MVSVFLLSITISNKPITICPIPGLSDTGELGYNKTCGGDKMAKNGRRYNQEFNQHQIVMVTDTAMATVAVITVTGAGKGLW